MATKTNPRIVIGHAVEYVRESASEILMRQFNYYPKELRLNAADFAPAPLEKHPERKLEQSHPIVRMSP